MIEPLIIGHRGASAEAPENTMFAFARAMADGADGVEFDVQLSRDGVPVVIHDKSLKRTGLRSNLISDLSHTELENIDVGTWFNLRYPSRAKQEFRNAKVPTLAEVLDFFKSRPAVLYIEMKCTRRDSQTMAREVVRLIHRHQLADRVVVESFALDSIREIKKLDTEIRTAALFEPKVSRPIRRKRTLIEDALIFQADEIALHRSLATRRAVEMARNHGLRVVVWTVDHPSWIERSLSQGIHAIISNVPGRMSAARRDLFLVNETPGRNARGV